jgi:tetratricopeptide (TPR) repeat protein
VRPDLPVWVDDMVRRMLAKTAADRYRSSAHLHVVLKAGAAGKIPSARRVRPVLAGVAVAAGLVLALGVMVLPRGSTDPNKVMGFPLLAMGGASPSAVEQVEEAVAAAMQDTDPLRWLRARLFLGGTAKGGLPADSATRLARARGARYWMGGSLSVLGDSLVVRLELFDAKADSLVASRAEAGPLSTPPYTLAFRAVNALLPRIVGRSTHIAEKYLERHVPAAVAKWLEGEVAYRNARYVDAFRFYRDALAADSSLVSAALKGAMTAAWLVEYEAGDSLIRLALSREADLPPVNRMFARGLLHQFEGNGDSALAWFRQVVQAAPEWSEGWYGIGEATYHLWPAWDNLDSLARDAFERALVLDPDFAPVVFHLAELTIVSGELKEAERLVARHRTLSADTVQQMQLDVMLACVRRGPATVDWNALAARAEEGFQLLTAGRLLAAGGRYFECAEHAYRAALLSPAPDPDFSRRWNAALGLHHIFVARGENTRARRFADSLAANGVAGGRGLWILEAVLGAVSDSAGRAEIAALTIPLDSMSMARLWWFGEWSAQYGDSVLLVAVTDHLRRRAQASGRSPEQVPARALTARLLLARGDTAGAIDSLRAIQPVAPLPHLVWRYWEALAPERLLLARLLLARGRAAEALHVARSFDGQRTAVDVAYLPASLEVRRQAAERMRNRDGADEYAERLVALSRQ